MAKCIVCERPATVALHAISQEFPDSEAPGGQFHYTELVFACDQHKVTPDLIRVKLPDLERFWWTLQADETPIAVCPQCGRERHAAHIWTCPECGRTGCSGCMMRYEVTGTCGEDVKLIHDAAREAALEKYRDVLERGDAATSERRKAEIANEMAAHAAKVAEEGIAELAAKHGGTG